MYDFDRELKIVYLLLEKCVSAKRILFRKN